MIKRIEVDSKEDWNQSIENLPGVSVLQTWEWGQVKNQFGWEPFYFLWKNASEQIVGAALVLIREITIPLFKWNFKTIYIPQGPLLDWSNDLLREHVLDDLCKIAKEKSAFFLKIDPEIIIGLSEEINTDSIKYKNATKILESIKNRGYQYSSQQIQFKNTAWLDLSQPEEDLLASMKQKTRYNIRLANRKGVEIRQGSVDDIDLLYQMYLDTSLRDGFIIRPKEYYKSVWTNFINGNKAVPLIAEFEKEPIAGLMLFHFANRSWYLYGMSTNAHRENMPNYLLQWEAIKISKQMGCLLYDLWGAPDIFDQNDRMWGVYRFKKGLGAQPVQRIGAYDLPINKFAYKIFVGLLPRLQTVTRRVRKVQQIQELN